jgi:hypothetical protein
MNSNDVFIFGRNLLLMIGFFSIVAWSAELFFELSKEAKEHDKNIDLWAFIAAGSSVLIALLSIWLTSVAKSKIEDLERRVDELETKPADISETTPTTS